MPLALSQPTPSEALSPSFEPGRTLGVVELALLWQLLDEDPLCPSRVVLAKLAQRQGGVRVSVRHLNRLRAKWKRNRPKGRPRQLVESAPGPGNAALVRLTPHLSGVGVHLDLMPYRELATPKDLKAALHGMDRLLIDATERAYHRSTDDATQREHYSGKKNSTR